MMTVLYNVILALAALILIPYYAVKIALTGKYRKSIAAKFGFIPPEALAGMKGTPRIWIHAVSVGEVTAAAPVIAALRQARPGACIVLSTSTETGQDMARRIASAASSLIYYPLDISWVVRSVLDRVKPDVFVLVETELWPNFLRICADRGIRTVMVNGRVSPRSYGRYVMTRFFWRRVLALLDEFGAISSVDAERLVRMGAPHSRVRIIGNAKYDGLAARVDPSLHDEISERFAIPPGATVLVAGSTHEGEEKIVLSAYLKLRELYPGIILILVPRHVERADDVCSLVAEMGVPHPIRMTEINAGKRRDGHDVIVVDVIGELFKVYSMATVVYCGGSLVPKGGQNILEPAAWGKVVLYGPSMEDFVDERQSLEQAGAGIMVHDEKELFGRLRALIGDARFLAERGERGREVVTSNMGASRRYAELVLEVLSKTS